MTDIDRRSYASFGKSRRRRAPPAAERSGGSASRHRRVDDRAYLRGRAARARLSVVVGRLGPCICCSARVLGGCDCLAVLRGHRRLGRWTGRWRGVSRSSTTSGGSPSLPAGHSSPRCSSGEGGLADVAEPHRRDHDAVRGGVRGDLSDPASRPPVVLLLAVPVSRTRWTLWPQFRSPLLWDFFAILAYVVASMLFWYLGLIPDLATMRDRATTRVQADSSMASWRWASAARTTQWRHYHADVRRTGRDHGAAGRLRAQHRRLWISPARRRLGWHSTQFPPFFVFGAVLSGFATVLLLIAAAAPAAAPARTSSPAGTSTCSAGCCCEQFVSSPTPT